MKKNPENLRSSASQKGFTLLEVLIALVILSVGLLGLASLTASIIRTNSFSDDFTTATALAQDQLENLYNTPFGSLTVGTTSDTVNADGSAGTKYSRSWTVAINGTRADITVSVSWSDDLGNTRSVSTSTVKADY